MKKLPEFLSKLRESEKVETMGRTARRRKGVFFGRLGVPERSGAGAAGSGRCAVGVFFGEGGGRAVCRARRGARCGAGCRRGNRRGVCFSVGGGEEHGRGGAGGRGERRGGLRWPPCGFVLMVQRSDFVRKKIDFSESCTTKRRRTAVGCCKLVGASRGPLQACSPGACEPAPTGVQVLGTPALRSPRCPRSHAPSPTTCGDGSGSEGELLRGGLQ